MCVRPEPALRFPLPLSTRSASLRLQRVCPARDHHGGCKPMQHLALLSSKSTVMRAAGSGRPRGD